VKKIVIALAIFAAAAFGFYRLTEWKNASERAAAQEQNLLWFDEREVTGITVTVGGADWVLEKTEDSRWEIMRPIQDLASRPAVLNLMSEMRQTQLSTTIQNHEPLAAYGLDPPRARIHLHGVQVPDLLLGNLSPNNESVFLKVEGRRGVLVADLKVDSLFHNMDPSRFRDRDLLGLPVNRVVGIHLRQAPRQIDLELRGGGWWITEKYDLPASDNAVNRLLESLGDAVIQEFLDGRLPSEKGFHLGNDALAVRLTGKEKERTVLLGAANDAGFRFAKRDDRAAVLLVAGDGLHRIEVRPEAYLTRKLTKANRYKVRSFTYSDRKAEISLSGDPAADQWTGPDGKVRGNELVYPLLVRLLESPVTGWEEGGLSGTASAVVDYEMEDGSADRITFDGKGRAALGSLPGVRFLVRSTPPAVPQD